MVRTRIAKVAPKPPAKVGLAVNWLPTSTNRALSPEPGTNVNVWVSPGLASMARSEAMKDPGPALELMLVVLSTMAEGAVGGSRT